MAGIIFVTSIIATTVLFNFDRSQTWLLVAATLGAGAVGLADDILNIKGLGGGVAGLPSKLKLILMTIVALLGGWYFYSKLGYDSVYVTFIGDLELGLLLIPLFTLVVVSTANAVNIMNHRTGKRLSKCMQHKGFGKDTLGIFDQD